ncbi:MAG TPA: glutamate--tRNA ligase [Patescibacteria group bacterium]|nr:glutamate--tRNA ligase [Patescibacteria group bacterium]
MAEIRTRIAPSPTGFAHVGTLRSALFNFLFARKNHGKFVLRVEDTDQNRLVEGALEDVVKVLHDFKLDPDEGFVWDNGVKEQGPYAPYLQSKRLPIYKKYAEELIEKNHAYYCFCTPQRLEDLRKSQEAQKLPPKYDKLCLSLSKEEVQQKLANNEPHVIRLNVPADQTIRFTDLIHGEISISTNDIDDQVLLKSDGFPTYHLAVVVDDYLMNINYVLRGDEWLPSTPKHILLYSAFGWPSPQYAHLPLLLSKSKKKLSKREGDVAVKDFLAQGYLPEALLNFVALLGWNPKTEQEIFTLDELIEQFSLDKVNKSGAVFDLEKLDWINGLYIRKLSLEELFARISEYLSEAKTAPREFVLKILGLEQGRLKKLSEIGDRVRYFFHEPEYDPALLVWKKGSAETAKQNLIMLSSVLSNFDKSEFIKDNLELKIKNLITEKDLTNGEVLWPLRVALSGLEASPSPFEIMDAFSALPGGKEIILKRLQNAINSLA